MRVSAFLSRLTAAAGLLFLVGCATQQPVLISTDFVAKADFKPTIGIAMTPSPVPNARVMGQVGLLDYAIIASANKKLGDHLKTLDVSEFAELQDQLVARFKARGFNAVKIEQRIAPESLPKAKGGIGFSKKDFSSIKEQNKVDQIVLIQLVGTGTTRAYYGPVPMAAPNTYASAQITMVDIATGKLNWFETIEMTQPVAGEWDEPDNGFANATNGVYQVLDALRTGIETRL